LIPKHKFLAYNKEQYYLLVKKIIKKIGLYNILMTNSICTTVVDVKKNIHDTMAT